MLYSSWTGGDHRRQAEPLKRASAPQSRSSATVAASQALYLQRTAGNRATGSWLARADAPTCDVVVQRAIPRRVKPGDNVTSRAARGALDRARREAILAYKAGKITWGQFIEIHARIRR